jgi:hypothetical protein
MTDFYRRQTLKALKGLKLAYFKGRVGLRSVET